ncbi:pyridoxamine 5'-phosphate oxidase family protein [Methylocystis heyeri]|uniref:Pyridoxamine 5'-phosphate oxidase N-terminal domain-containing protein n=1 Tax=Methylocystis heyeri TaxID=391905 RepID=A0A6B8KJM6_9HYPH|nr:pyridoxamine 5'-phosphate oxidase family protein [Methylocystis heyeri]QGM46783.1 hypothetical protein H2LOC_014370 [Methylocystis heyeri]
MTLEEFDQALGDILEQVPVVTLATCADGVPWATDVYFATQGRRLVFLSSPTSRHCRNLAAQPTCAATIHPVVASWRDIRGVQMEGRAEPLSELLDKASAMAAYVTKFPFVADLLTHPGEVARKAARVTPHVFIPTRIRYLDNRLGFGTRFVVRLEDGLPLGSPEREDSQ